MKTEDFIRAAAETIRIVRILSAGKDTMRYGVLLRLLRVIPDEGPWQRAYIHLCTKLVDAAADMAERNGEKIARKDGEPGLEFWRFVNSSGQPGKGLAEWKAS